MRLLPYKQILKIINLLPHFITPSLIYIPTFLYSYIPTFLYSYIPTFYKAIAL